jgi:protein-S-isoprenylcysteine O-methyltransferase Ste14
MNLKANLKALMGSGDKIMLLTLPVLLIGLVLNILYPSFFSVGGPSPALRTLSIITMIPGIIIWLWSVVLVLTRVPKHELITDGPYALVKHPLYTSVALLVLPWLGFLLDTWLGLVVGIVLYLAARRYAPEEERGLATSFGAAWDNYCQRVKLQWL